MRVRREQRGCGRSLVVAIRLGRSLRAHASRTSVNEGVYVEERTGYPRGGGNTEARWERRETWARAQRYNKPHPLPWELPRPRTPHDAQRGYRALPHLGYSHSKAYHQRCHLSPTHRASPASGHCTPARAVGDCQRARPCSDLLCSGGPRTRQEMTRRASDARAGEA